MRSCCGTSRHRRYPSTTSSISHISHRRCVRAGCCSSGHAPRPQAPPPRLSSSRCETASGEQRGRSASCGSAIRPNARVQALVAQLVDSANLHAGPRWAAVHFAIERDWWWDSEICAAALSGLLAAVLLALRGGRHHSRSLAEQRATGTLMMVAHDKVASMARRCACPPWERELQAGARCANTAHASERGRAVLRGACTSRLLRRHLQHLQQGRRRDESVRAAATASRRLHTTAQAGRWRGASGRRTRPTSRSRTSALKR